MCASLFAALAYDQANFWVYRDEQAWISWNSFIIAPMYNFGHNLAWYAWSLRTWPMAYCTIFNVYAYICVVGSHVEFGIGFKFNGIIVYSIQRLSIYLSNYQVVSIHCLLLIYFATLSIFSHT